MSVLADWRLAVAAVATALLVVVGLVAYRREMWLRGKREWWL